MICADACLFYTRCKCPVTPGKSGHPAPEMHNFENSFLASAEVHARYDLGVAFGGLVCAELRGVMTGISTVIMLQHGCNLAGSFVSSALGVL